MEVTPASDRSLLVSFGDEISPAIHRQVRALTFRLLQLPELRNVHPGYATVLVTFDPLRVRQDQLERAIRAHAEHLDEWAAGTRKLEIPVCYGGEFGPDLADVARHNGLTPEQVVEIHSSVEYLVYFLGFSPGFPYLGGMPRSIAAPRLASPRTRVPAGSVAIGGEQTGIYPVSSPGGWRIIGRTPRQLFHAERNPPALLAMGDAVRFISIERERFERERDPG